jgi:hypothetical protein
MREFMISLCSAAICGYSSTAGVDGPGGGSLRGGAVAGGSSSLTISLPGAVSA